MSEYRDGVRLVVRESFWTFPRAIVILVLLLAVAYGVGFLATGGDVAIYRFWAPKQAAAERQVFENTPSYILGMSQQITQLKLEYDESTDPADKTALKDAILHIAAQVDNSKLPVDQQVFINQLKGDN